MRGLLYRAFAGASRWVGLWLVAVFAWVVSTGYYLFRPRRVAVSVEFYETLFPERGRAHARRLAWRQYHQFATLFVERVRLRTGAAPVSEEQGLERLEAAAREGRGGILVMSHVGPWEIAARLLQRRGLPMLLHMGAREREQVERLQKADLRADGVQVVVATPAEDSAFDAVESLGFLRGGGFVSLPADRVPAGSERAVAVRLFDRAARLSAAPWILALLSGAPLFHFFAVRLGPGRFRFSVSPPVRVEARARAERDAAIRTAAQAYADELAAVVRRHPEQWFSFERVLE